VDSTQHNFFHWFGITAAAVLLLLTAWVINSEAEFNALRDAKRGLATELEILTSAVDIGYREALNDAGALAADPRLKAGVADITRVAGVHSPARSAQYRKTLQDLLQAFARDERFDAASLMMVDLPGKPLAAEPDAAAFTQVRMPDLARIMDGETIFLPPRDRPAENIAQSPQGPAPPAATIIAPVREGAETVALLQLGIAPAIARGVLAGHVLNGSSETFLFDRSGQILARRLSRRAPLAPDTQPRPSAISGPPRYAGFPGSGLPTTDPVPAEPRISATPYTSHAGVEVLGAWIWLDDYAIGIAAEIRPAEAFASLQSLQNAVNGITLVACALLLMMGLMTTRQRKLLQRQVATQTAALRFEKTKLQQLFDTAPGGLITTDEQGRITDVSLQAQTIFGENRRALLGRSLDQLFAEDLPLLDNGSGDAFVQINARRAGGSLVPVELALSRAQTERGAFGLAIARDISDLKKAQRSMQKEIERREQIETRQRLLLEAAGEGIFGIDRDRKITFINPAGAKMLGCEPALLLGEPITGVGPESPGICGQDNLLAQLHGIAPFTAETRLRRSDGELFDVEFTSSPLIANGTVTGYVVLFSDITQRKLTEKSLQLADSVFRHITEGVLVAGAGGTILRVNRALCDMVGYSEQELIGQSRPPYRSGEHPPVFYQQLWDTLLENGLWEGEIWNRRKSGEIFPTWQTIVAVRNGTETPEQFVSVTRDITEQRRSEQRIHKLAYFDTLTNLPNRELFFDRFGHAIARAQRQGTEIALLFLDLDRFKNVNDTLGHPVGDRLLQAVAERLQCLVRGEDTIARLGGDEFTILLESVGHHGSVSEVARKVVDGLSEPFSVDAQQLHIGTSVGISLYPADGEDATTLVKHADAAMYQAKAAGRSNYQFYAESMSSHSSERVAMEAHLHRAINNGEFILHFQPQYSSEGRLIGVEALIRWDDPVMGLIAPDRFIPLAEETGLIVAIGEWVLFAACRQLVEWRNSGAPPMRISVNLAGPQIIRGNIVATVARALEETGIDADALELEVTETFVMDQIDHTVEILSDLRALGVRIAIDDFGTGHSSLATLKRLPADTLKIDRAFVRDIPEDPNDMAIARAILAMGRQLKLKTVAEGVETDAQRDFLASEGCDYFQGFFFARPLPAEAIETLWHTPRAGQGGWQ
jgi:diguanylate cyclase (GGDEF)-like protein/PAS domain S-box-containing protein